MTKEQRPAGRLEPRELAEAGRSLPEPRRDRHPDFRLRGCGLGGSPLLLFEAPGLWDFVPVLVSRELRGCGAQQALNQG